MQNNENVKIKEMYREERPYEKCEQYGAENLTDAELLAVLLRTGTKGENSLRLAQKILHPETDRGGLVNLPQWTVEQLRQVRGIGKVKAIQNRWLGRRPKGRGVAMNPIDHPLGGGEGRSSGGAGFFFSEYDRPLLYGRYAASAERSDETTFAEYKSKTDRSQ